MKDNKVKGQMLTLRIGPDQQEFIDITKRVLQSNRPGGSSEVTKSEAVNVLMDYGWKLFSADYKAAVQALLALKSTKVQKKKSA